MAMEFGCFAVLMAACFPFCLLPSLPHCLACGSPVEERSPSPPRGGGTLTWGLMSLQEESRRMSSVSTQGALAKPGTAMTPSGGSRLPVTSL